MHVIGKIARITCMPSDHSKVTKYLMCTEQFTKWNYNHAKCNCSMLHKQEILGNFQAAQSLSASFPWAVMYK